MGLKDRQHIFRLIETIYKFRSDRGAVHISATYDANSMDSMLIIHGGKWILGEFLRIAWNQDRDIVAGVIEQLVQLEISLIHHLDGKPLVLVKDISAPDEVLLLLYQTTNNRLSRSELRLYASRQKPNTLKVATTRLVEDRDIRVADDDDLVLTPKGQKRVMERILPKLGPTSTSR